MAVVQIHLFRVMASHRVQRLGVTVNYPVTGLIVAPTTITDLDDYMNQRWKHLATIRIATIAKNSPHEYARIAAAMTLAPEIRKSKGLEPPMPPPGLQHTSPAVSCEACRTIALCNRSAADYQRLRSTLERVAGGMRRSELTACEALEAQLNR